MSALLRLYPGAWRDRYGEEMHAVLETRRPSRRDRIDLIRGAFDAWIHPLSPSMAPSIAAIVGGGLWTMIGAATFAQPAPPDWPGYLIETLPLATIAAVFLFVAAAGCLLRTGEAPSRPRRLAMVAIAIGYGAWFIALGLGTFGVIGRAPIAAAQDVAMVATTLVGLLLLQRGDLPIGIPLSVAPAALIVPWTGLWLAFGAVWTAVGLTLWVDRGSRMPAAPA
jgi:hypothetical protein